MGTFSPLWTYTEVFLRIGTKTNSRPKNLIPYNFLHLTIFLHFNSCNSFLKYLNLQIFVVLYFIGAETLGYPGVIHGLFPKGGFELVHYFYQKSNRQLIEEMKVEVEKADQIPAMKKSEKEIVTEAIEKRLKMIEPYIGQWAQALALTTLPSNTPTALANLLTLVDDICYYSGDRSVDMTWYGKRIFLAGIYKATELYMLQDKSEGYTQTWLFLRRRMDEASQLHSYIAQSEQASQFAKEFTTAAFVTVIYFSPVNFL
ncbi:hypothetical protein AAG570_013704 [Ranatra chinensis]|uniref:Ubiquinone biosynthesis protein n=1 Tax=Ranatra chinensis TaxID=642074 RepID=A0ABD0YDM5_9HEMI